MASRPKDNLVAPVPQAYFIVADIAGEKCYLRYLGTYPLDSVCMRGADVRYSPTFVAPDKGQAIPVHVEALFEKMPLRSVLETRRAEQAKWLSGLKMEPR